MPKIKIDTSGVTEEEAKAFGSGSGESPRPGVYKAKIMSATPGYAKGDDGEADKARPRIEVVYQIQGGEFGGSQVWQYPLLPGHDKFGDSAKKRLFQLLRACGLPTNAKELDTDKLVGKAVRVRVRKGENNEGDYRGEFGAVFKDSDSDIKLGYVGDDPRGAKAAGPFDEPSDGDSSDELLDDEAITDDSGTDWDARLAELNAMSVDDLKAVAREWKEAGWDIKIGGKKSDVASAVVEVEKSAAEQSGGDDDETILDDGDDEVLDDGSDEDLILDDDDNTEYLTEEQLKAMDGPALIKLAKDDFDIDAKAQGLKTKNALVAAILEAQAAPTGNLDEPF